MKSPACSSTAEMALRAVRTFSRTSSSSGFVVGTTTVSQTRQCLGYTGAWGVSCSTAPFTRFSAAQFVAVSMIPSASGLSGGNPSGTRASGTISSAMPLTADDAKAVIERTDPASSGAARPMSVFSISDVTPVCGKISIAKPSPSGFSGLSPFSVKRPSGVADSQGSAVENASTRSPVPGMKPGIPEETFRFSCPVLIRRRISMNSLTGFFEEVITGSPQEPSSFPRGRRGHRACP